jgi:peptidoglycan hydrolase-like protein with peptidoglycan-binding domain
MVAENLEALGYDIGRQPKPGSTVTQPPAGGPSPSAAPTPAHVEVRRGDGVVTAALIRSVRRWQGAAGLPATGIVGPGDVAVFPQRLRVSALAVRAGDRSDAKLMEVTGTAKVVTVSLGASDTRSLRRGDAVTVTLPDGARATARISAIGTELKPDDNGSEEAKLTVTIVLDRPAVAAKIDKAPVQAEIVGETREDVLTVPVGALLAVLEGGYAVQIAGGPTVPVKVGLFADGRVEISGSGIAAGVSVVTTS